jgi:hypothetical protein
MWKKIKSRKLLKNRVHMTMFIAQNAAQRLSTIAVV